MTKSEFEQYKVDHLFLLVGENPLPNYVAAKLLLHQGGTAYLVHTTDTSDEAKRLKTSFENESENKFNVKFLPLNQYESDAYHIQKEINAKLKSINNGKIGLNYTGGTKAMSAHSYRTLFYEEIQDKTGKVYRQRNGIIFSYSKSHILYLPFRPLVYGGDDITFICEGRLGLELATLFLQKFEAQKVSDGNPLTACAGVCIVKTHYPFARAYKMSEDLCKSAKKFVKDERQKDGADYFSAIDWHFAASGLLGSISEIRQREYQININNQLLDLAMRPLWLENQNEWRTWSGFTQVISEFKQGDEWKERKNKIMALREVLRKGSIDVEQFLLTYKLPNLPSFSDSSGQNDTITKKGWENAKCGYFDAIEAMDFYLGIGSK